jgi:hypothetical protein
MSNGTYRFVETLLHDGISAGCGGGNYCPSSSDGPELVAGFGDATLRERYRCSKTNQEGNGRDEVYESRPLARELEASAVVGDQPDGGRRKETAELDGDALKLTILKPRA